MSAGVRLSLATMRAVFPNTPEAIVNAFIEKQGVMAAVGLNQSRQRLAYCFANLHAETSGFTIRNLTENINYKAVRMAQVWPNRFASAATVQTKYGTAPGWQTKAFDDIYGNRMGNRPGTADGSRYIGRGGPQITGRDGYAEIGRRIGVDLVDNPEMASSPALQPDIASAFWDWKRMNKYADAGDFIGCVKAWNGGTNGLAQRQTQLVRILPILQKAEWGEVVAVSAKPPPDTVLDSISAPSQPPVWAAFFMAMISAVARLLRRA